MKRNVFAILGIVAILAIGSAVFFTASGQQNSGHQHGDFFTRSPKMIASHFGPVSIGTLRFRGSMDFEILVPHRAGHEMLGG